MLESERTTERFGNALAFKWTIETNAGVIKVEELWWGRSYEGRRDALIAAGILDRGHFPGDDGVPRKTSYHTTVHRDGEDVGFDVRRLSTHRFNVCINFSERQRDRFESRVQAIEAAEKSQRWIDGLPTDADDFRTRMTTLVEATTELQKTALEKMGHGYFFERSAIERFEWATNEAVKALEDGKVKFDARRRAQAIAEIRGESSKADTDFQQFIGSTFKRGDDPSQAAE
jgi:hypothetical protein